MQVKDLKEGDRFIMPDRPHMILVFDGFSPVSTHGYGLTVGDKIVVLGMNVEVELLDNEPPF